MLTPLTLEQAQYHYGRSLVPWILDEKDLDIINQARQDYMDEHGTLCTPPTTQLQDFFLVKSLESIVHGRLWLAAQS